MSAYFSDDRVYRYSLAREVPSAGIDTVTFIGLNPSTADETIDDPTIRRCIDFARRWGFARLKMLNLYAFRATDPKVMLAADDPIGPENDCTIAKVVGGSNLVVVAWGANAEAERVEAVLELVAYPRCLGVTKSGAPRHPLYIKASTTPQAYRTPARMAHRATA